MNNKPEEDIKDDENSNNSGIESDSDSDDGVKKGNERDSFNQMENNSRAFIKNILLKYLEYSANAQQKESMMMEKVLFTALKVHDNEIKILEEARVKAYN